jgi:hypothetical protein
MNGIIRVRALSTCLLQGKFTLVFNTLLFFQINIPNAFNTYVKLGLLVMFWGQRGKILKREKMEFI